jgi:hypothetical protein
LRPDPDAQRKLHCPVTPHALPQAVTETELQTVFLERQYVSQLARHAVGLHGELGGEA